MDFKFSLHIRSKLFVTPAKLYGESNFEGSNGRPRETQPRNLQARKDRDPPGLYECIFLWIFKPEKHLKLTPGSCLLKRYYAFSESGFINQQIWGTVMLLFFERFNMLHPGMNAVLNPVVVGMAYQQHVHMWSLVANSSHFLQPLDDLPFGAFKKYTAAVHNDRSFKAKLHSS